MLAALCLAASIVAPAAGGDGGASSARSADAPSVIIRKVYRYRDAGLFKPEAGEQFVAVDIEFRGFADLDLDDVEIIDAATDETLDAGPEAAFLRPDGGFYSVAPGPGARPPANPADLRGAGTREGDPASVLGGPSHAGPPRRGPLGPHASRAEAGRRMSDSGHPPRQRLRRIEVTTKGPASSEPE